jgi:hypothetical protein
MMLSLSPSKLAIGIAVIGVSFAAVLGISHLRRESSFTPNMPHSVPAPPTKIIHDAAWYVAHRQAMDIDEAKCERNDREIATEACQNITSAEQQLAVSELKRIEGQK